MQSTFTMKETLKLNYKLSLRCTIVFPCYFLVKLTNMFY